MLLVWPNVSQQFPERSSVGKNETIESESESESETSSETFGTNLESTNRTLTETDDASSILSREKNEGIEESIGISNNETNLLNIFENFSNVSSNENNDDDNLIFLSEDGSGSGDLWSDDNSTVEEPYDSWSNDSLFINETSNEAEPTNDNLTENKLGIFNLKMMSFNLRGHLTNTNEI